MDGETLPISFSLKSCLALYGTNSHLGSMTTRIPDISPKGLLKCRDPQLIHVTDRRFYYLDSTENKANKNKDLYSGHVNLSRNTFFLIRKNVEVRFNE